MSVLLCSYTAETLVDASGFHCVENRRWRKSPSTNSLPSGSLCNLPKRSHTDGCISSLLQLIARSLGPFPCWLFTEFRNLKMAGGPECRRSFRKCVGGNVILPSRPITDLAVRVVATRSYIFEEVRVRVRRRVRRMVHVNAYATPYLLRAPDAEV